MSDGAPPPASTPPGQPGIAAPDFPVLPKPKPAAGWYALVVPIIFAGIVLAVLQGVDEAKRVGGSFVDLGSDARGEVDLRADDTQTVWATWKHGRSLEDVERPESEVTITGPRGEQVEFDAASSSSRSTFSFGEYSGIDLGTFTPTTSGEHHVVVEFAAAEVAEDQRAGIGSFDVIGAIGRVFAPIGIAIGAAIAFVVVLSIMRARSRRRIAIESARASSATAGPFG